MIASDPPAGLVPVESGIPAGGEMAAAVADGQLTAYVQPIVHLGADETVVAGESLMRWRHPERGLLDAAAFVHRLAEEGILAAVDRTYAGRLAAELGRDDPDGTLMPRLWVNLSRGELLDEAVSDAVVAEVAAAGLGAHRIGFEIDETTVAADYDRVVAHLRRIRALGAGAALDNIGGSWLVAAHLDDLPVDVVKLNGSIVDRIDSDQQHRQLVAGVIARAHEGGRTVVAQRVERADQIDVLIDLACDWGQGHGLGRPQPLRQLLGAGASGPPPEAWLG